MPVLNLTKRSVDALTPGAKAFIAFDSQVHGFGVRVMPSGVKTFILEYRPNGGGRAVAKRRLKIGRFGPLTVDEAREKAKRAHARVELGADPSAEKAEQRAAVTVGGLIDAFIAEHVETKCKGGTAEAHKVALEKLRAAYGGLKAESLTRPQLASLHAKMRSHPYAANRFLAVVSKAFNWAGRRGLVPETHNPASRIERYRETQRERFLNTSELARLGETLRQGETIGLPWTIDETKPNAKHAPKESNRRRILDPHATAAIRLLILTGARLREILHAKWEHVDFERGVILLPDEQDRQEDDLPFSCCPGNPCGPAAHSQATLTSFRAELRASRESISRSPGPRSPKQRSLKASAFTILGIRSPRSARARQWACRSSASC